MENAEIEKLAGAALDREIAERLRLTLAGHEDGVLWVRDEHMRCFPFSPTSDWNQLGPLLLEHRIALYPTMARGTGAGHGHPGWMGSADPGQPFVDPHILTAGSRALLKRLSSR